MTEYRFEADVYALFLSNQICQYCKNRNECDKDGCKDITACDDIYWAGFKKKALE